MKRILALITFASVLSASAQNKIDLSGVWEFQIQRSENTVTPISVYDDTIQLPGSMITRDKGDIVSVNTQWTGSLYDSSFYFNPYMEKYRVEGQMKFPFFLTLNATTLAMRGIAERCLCRRNGGNSVSS